MLTSCDILFGMELIECACGCGTTFPKYDKRGRLRRYLSPTHAIVHFNRKEVDENEMCELHSQHWTNKMLADHFAVSVQAIKRRLKKLDLKRLPNHFAGERNPAWRDGKRHMKAGYIMIYKPGHPRANAAYVYEHIVVWEESHGRPLPEGWVIHHINGIRSDNCPENLFACPKGKHHYALGYRQCSKGLENLKLKLKA